MDFNLIFQQRNLSQKKKYKNHTCKKHKYSCQLSTFSVIQQPKAKKRKTIEKQKSNKELCVFLPHFSCRLPFSILLHSRDTPFREPSVPYFSALMYSMFCAAVSYLPEEYFRLHRPVFPIPSKINPL